LQKLRVQTVGGKTFLVGKGIALSPKWKGYEGQTIWVSLHHIEQMFEFDSTDCHQHNVRTSDDECMGNLRMQAIARKANPKVYWRVIIRG
jgi:hypothetical protein